LRPAGAVLLAFAAAPARPRGRKQLPERIMQPNKCPDFFAVTGRRRRSRPGKLTKRVLPHTKA
jgi:hypothetical protein